MGWQRVKGHDALVEGFRRVVRAGRLAHGYLFAGPAGVGKRLFAVELARALLCESPTGELQACDRCHACVQVEAGTHPDFFAAERPPELHEFPIKLMQELCARFSLKAARGRGKVLVIDDGDDLNTESANSFLKTLEEPPPGSVLILIGTAPERQLPTILSRCQLVRFRPLPTDLVESILRENGVDDPAERARLARLGAGSPGQALALADPALWDFRRTLLAGLVKEPLDNVELARAFLTFVEEAGKESAAQRQRASLMLRLVMDVFGDALAVSHGAAPKRTGPEDKSALDSLAARLGPDGLLDSLERCLQADVQIDRRAQLVLVLEALLDALGQKAALTRSA